jgi:hypothetical protein
MHHNYPDETNAAFNLTTTTTDRTKLHQQHDSYSIEATKKKSSTLQHEQKLIKLQVSIL